MKSLSLLLFMSLLSVTSVAKADQSYMCSVVKFVPDTEDDDQTNAFTGPKATIITVQDLTILVGKDTFNIVQPKSVGLNIKTTAGYNAFSSRRIYKVNSKKDDVVFVSQPYNMNDGEVVPKDRITYSKCVLVTPGTING